MHLPLQLKCLNQNILKRLLFEVAAYANFGELAYVDRMTHAQMHTRVVAFPDLANSHVILSPTDARDRLWIRNVTPASGCTLTIGTRLYRLGPPRSLQAAQALLNIRQPHRTLLRWSARCREFTVLPILDTPTAPDSWETARLIAPSNEGFVVAALASRRHHPIANPFHRRSSRATAALDQLAGEIAAHDHVLETVRLEAVLGAPGNPPRDQAPGQPWDHVLLVRTNTPAEAQDIAAIAETHLSQRTDSPRLVTAARNVRRIADVAHPNRGVYLLNFFTGPDIATTLDVWQHTAGWFQDETGLTNSTVLQPLSDDTGYTVINHCRWDRWGQVLPQLLGKRSFRDYVLRRFSEVDVQPHPILYKVTSAARPQPT